MEFSPNNIYKEYGRVDTVNINNGVLNYSVTLLNDEVINIKVINDELVVGNVYLLEFECSFNGTRNVLTLLKKTDIFKCMLCDDVYAVFKKYYSYVSVGIPYLEKKLDEYLSSIKNPVIKAICDDVFNRYRHDFLIYPAAVKMHHNYLGGLAYHTLTMCDLAKAFAGIYDSIDLDLLIGGALLHDASKIIEFKGPIDSEYSIRGQLIGHLVLGTLEIEKTAERLGLLDKEEVMLLEHMLISHHGQPQFGACKKPETPEALLLWIIDTIDSKMRVLDETFERVEPGSFSEGIGVLERMKFYKRK
jgi:3'-5' exoribonuclease